MPKLIAGEKTYEIGELTLGEFRLLKARYGVERMDLLDPRDPDHLVGFIVLAELRENPRQDVAALEERIGKLTTVDFQDDEAEEDEAPLDSPGTPSDSAPPATDVAPAGTSG